MNNKGKIYILIGLLVWVNPLTTVKAQRYYWNMNCVEQFTDRVSIWLKTNDIEHRISAENTCSGKYATRVTDELADYLAIRNNQTGVNGSYTLDTYLNSLQKERSKNHVSLTYSKPTFISPNSIENPNDKVDHYVCDVDLLIDDNIHKRVKSIFYVVDGKVAKIDKYIVSKSNKITVDYKDFINSYGTVGFSYNYGQHFPTGGSFNYSFTEAPLMLSFDFGINLDGNKYIVDKVDMTNIMIYKREKKNMDPKFFLTITPQLYFRYASFGCGVGILYMGGTTETAYSTDSPALIDGDSSSISTNTSSSSSTLSTDVMLKPMIRPVAKGFIPLTNELYLSLSIGYDMVIGYKDKNGFNAGLGIQWKL